MPIRQTNQIQENFAKILQMIGQGMLGIITFFVYEIYNDFKEVRNRVEEIVTFQQLDRKSIEILTRDLDTHKAEQAKKDEDLRKWVEATLKTSSN